MELVRTFRIRMLFPNGLAYVGKETKAIDDVSCGAATADCVPYVIAGEKITLDGKELSYVKSGAKVSIGSDEWIIVGSEVDPFDGDYKLAGFFGYQSGSGAVVEGVSLAIATNGSLTVTRTAETGAKRLPKMVLGVDLWKDCVRPPAGGCSMKATYVLHGHSITITPAGEKARTLFFRRDGDVLQIGDDWYE